uniref:Uncharacterized protein n=1 Tax=Physcomitrium patens TaxID=3218 RepID=A0A2K1IS01_PHYPA|nr:hypothetical protein PHYPA_026184 [Physcomitrium patens]
MPWRVTEVNGEGGHRGITRKHERKGVLHTPPPPPSAPLLYLGGASVGEGRAVSNVPEHRARGCRYRMVQRGAVTPHGLPLCLALWGCDANCCMLPEYGLWRWRSMDS